MPFVPAENVVQVQVIYELDNQRVQNNWYFLKASEPTESDIADLLAGLATNIETGLLPLLSSAIKLVELIGTLLNAVDAISVTHTVSPGVPGEVADESAPSNVAYCVTFKTGFRGRAHRGRNYIAGIPNNEITLNTVSSAFRSGVVAFYDNLASSLGEFGWTMVVLSRFSGKDANGNPIPRSAAVVTPISSFGTFDATVDSQRRRLPGRGR